MLKSLVELQRGLQPGGIARLRIRLGSDGGEQGGAFGKIPQLPVDIHADKFQFKGQRSYLATFFQGLPCLRKEVLRDEKLHDIGEVFHRRGGINSLVKQSPRVTASAQGEVSLR